MQLPNKLDAPSEALTSFCPHFHSAVELIGRRWTGAILRAMMSGLDRFSDLSGAIPGLSDKMLSERLKELESCGMIARTVTPVTPVRIEYHLTEKGRDLEAVVEAIAVWADRWPNQAATERNSSAAESVL